MVKKEMSEEETKVLIIEALDHFRTTKSKSQSCVLRYIGESVNEDENYITLRYKGVFFNGKKDTEKLIKIIKKAIISKREFIEVKEK